MAFKQKQEPFKSTAGNDYTFQRVLPSVWARESDKFTDKNGKMLNEKAMPKILEHVVVEPSGLEMDDFESWGELEEVALAAFQFQRKRK
ncbi:hypothetical protein [Sporosarcina sp. FSL K6-1508]|uniref:hypothetical protein n=1 Tax=Sporosarcina sp. FSL K6-1508 TaxID=2921553 RepID=UPI0030F8715E